jgi:hypothetical protein
MKKSLLVTAAISALIAGTTLAAAQSPEQGKPAARPEGAQAQPKAPPAGAMRNPQQAAPNKAAQGEPARQGEPAKQGEPQRAQKEGPAAVPQRGAEERKPGNTGGAAVQNKPAAAGGGAKLSQDQRTKVRDVLVQHDVVRIDHPQFSVTVGTRIPRDAHIAVLPEDIVVLVPEYRGFEYVMVGDDILIIDPNTLEIVAIIPA